MSTLKPTFQNSLILSLNLSTWNTQKKTSDFEDKGAQLFCFLCCFQGPSHVILIAELAGTRHLHAGGFISQAKWFIVFSMHLLLSAQCQETKTKRQPKPLCHESLKPSSVSVIYDHLCGSTNVLVSSVCARTKHTKKYVATWINKYINK